MGKKNGRGRAHTIVKNKRGKYKKRKNWKVVVFGWFMVEAWARVHEKDNKEG